MKYICIVPNYWGTGKTPQEAKTNCRKAGGRIRHGKVKVFKTNDDAAYVDEITGGIYHRKGTTVEEVK